MSPDASHDAFVDAHPAGTFQQLRAWGELNERHRGPAHRVVAARDGATVGAAQLLTVPFRKSDRCFLWSPGGYLADLDDRESLRRLTDAVREVASRTAAVFVRISPAVRCRDAPDLPATLGDLGFEHLGHGSMRHRTVPRYMTWVHLDRPIERIFEGFAKKTRQYIRLARRHGIEVREGGEDDLVRFEEMWRSTAARCGFRPRPLAWLRDLHELFAREDRLRFLVATAGAAPDAPIVAGIVALASARHVAALLGPNEDREHRATRLLHWEVIRWAAERGAAVCDLRGSGSPEPESDRYGLFRFKRGFRGELVEPAGEFDLVLDADAYRTLLDKSTGPGARQKKVFKDLRAEI